MKIIIKNLAMLATSLCFLVACGNKGDLTRDKPSQDSDATTTATEPSQDS